MLDREGLKRNTANLRRDTFFDQTAVVDGAVFQCLPCLLRREHRAWRALFQAPGVVRMRMGEYDRGGMQTFDFAQPIKAAVNHNSVATVGQEHGGVHPMPPRPCLNLSARAEECEFHRRKPSLFLGCRAIYQKECKRWEI